MALLLGSEKVTVDFPAKTVLDEVTAGIMEGDRIGIVGRNGDGKSTLLTVLAGTYEPDGGRVVRRSGVSVGLLGQTDALDSAQTVAHEVVGDRPEYEWASDAARARHHRRPAGGRAVERLCGQPLRRPAPPRGPGAPARGRLGHPHARRADEPPGRARHRVAGGPPEAPLARGRGRAARRHARPLVPRRGMPVHVGGPRRHGGALRGRVLRLYPAARGARSPGLRGRTETPEHPAQGARMARARSASARHEAEIPHRRGARAHRRRAACARHAPAQADGHAASGQARHRHGARDEAPGRAHGARRRHLAYRPGRPLRHPGRERRRQDDASAHPARRARAGRRPREDRPDREVRHALAAFAGAQPVRRRSRARGARPLQDALRGGRPRAFARPDDRAPGLQEGAPERAREGPVRRPEAPPAVHAHPARRAERAHPGRAGQRPGHGHARRHGGSARRVAGHAACSSRTTATSWSA